MSYHLLIVALASLFSGIFPSLPVAGAGAFADPVFADAWQLGDTATPNFWGPLTTARDGMMEQFEYEGTQSPRSRLVQYFDKGRMEFNPGSVTFYSDTVTFGRLVTEMIDGQMILGTATVDRCSVPSIAIAGDDDPRNPTYASVASQRKEMLTNTPDKTGAYPVDFSDAAGNPKTGDPLLPLFQFVAYDASAHHNIPKVFADYRNQVNRFQPAVLANLRTPVQREAAGENILGSPMSEPFVEMVYVNGVRLPIVMQIFSRRVLTYNAANPEPYKVEMNNAGQHYYRWRYGSPGPNCH